MNSQTRRPISWQRAALTLGVVTMLVGPSTAVAAPTTMLFEGFLRSTGGGAAADGVYNVTYVLYESAQGQPFWTEGPVKVSVKGGQFAHVLGSTKPLDGDLLAAKGKAWVGIKVGANPTQPPAQLHPVPFAAYAVKAGGLACTGCVKLSSIKVDGDLNLGGNALKASTVVAQKIQAGALTSQTVQAGTIQAQKFVGDGSGLTGVGITAGACPKGKVVSGIDQAGKLICVSTAGALPPDGLKNVSNGVMSNNFTDSIVSSKVPIPIPDNNPVGVADTIDVPDLGTAEDLTVSVDVTNSKLDALEITIYDPNNDKYVLWNKGKAGGKVAATYPKPTPTLSGDLTKWVGKNPKGKWRIHVIDHAFKDNKADGAINKWSVNLHTLSNNKVLVKGDLVITGKVVNAGAPGSGSEVLLGSSNGPCNPDKKGLMRYHNDNVEVCNGASWNKLGSKGAMYRWAVWSTHSSAHSWYAGNNSAMFGGVNPSNWGDSNARAKQFSSTTELLKTLFVRKGPNIGAQNNATVYANEWRSYSSTNSKHIGVLFRIRNKTKSNITWNPHWYRTAYAGWGERASIAINGAEVWESGGNTYGPKHNSNHNITIPANRVSTVIFVAGSSNYNTGSYGGSTRACFLAFYNNSLKLPSGLKYIDDLDTKANGWNN